MLPPLRQGGLAECCYDVGISKVVENTPNWNIPLNLYQQVYEGIPFLVGVLGLAWGVQKTGVFRTFLGGIGSWLVRSGFYDREPLPVQSRPHELLQVPTAMLQHFQHQVGGGGKGRGYFHAF